MDRTRQRAGIALRISSDRTGEREGVQRHERECRRLAKALDVTVVQVYEDNSVSAFSGKNRPGYTALVADIEAGNLDVVLAWHPDRLHRNTEEHEEWIRLVRRTKVRVVTVLGGARDLTIAADRMVARVVVAASQYESELKSERQQSKAREAAERGRPNGGMRQFGYADAQRTALVDEEAEVLRGAVAKLLAGASKVEVVRWLNERSTTTTGRRWQLSNAMRVLGSASLAGVRELHTKDPDRREVTARDCWPAVIDEDTHRRVRRIVENGRGTGTRSVSKYLLTGIARCGLCGRTLTAQPRRDERSYRCDQQRGCGKIRVQAEPLEAWVRDIVFALVTDPDQVQRRTAEAAQLAGAEADTRAALDRLDTRQTILTESRLDGLPREEYRRAQRELNEERERLEKRLASLAGALGPVDAETRDEEVLARWESLTLGERREVVRTHLHDVVVQPAVRGRNFFDEDRVRTDPEFGPALARARRAQRRHPDLTYAEAVEVELRLVEVERA